MTIFAAMYAGDRAIFADHNSPTPKCRKLFVRFIDLVCPEAFSPRTCYYGVQESFGIAQWMLRSAKLAYRYGISGPEALLQRKPTCIDDYYGQLSFTDAWRSELADVFRYAILSCAASCSAIKWRDDNGISPSGSATLHLPRYDVFRGKGDLSNHDIGGMVDSLVNLDGRRFSFSPNECHKKARLVHGSYLIVEPECFRINLRYGYKNQSSAWYWSVKSQSKELFVDFLRRAAVELESVLEAVQ